MKQAAAGLLGGFLAVTSTPAAALECVYGSIQEEFWRAEKSSATYTLVSGRFSNLQLVESIKTKETSDGFQAGRQVFIADFTGFKPSRTAFDQPFSAQVRLVFPDESFIGGGHDTSGEAERLPDQVGLVWLLHTEAGYQASASSCSGIMDTEPSHVKPLLRCLRGGYCPKG